MFNSRNLLNLNRNIQAFSSPISIKITGDSSREDFDSYITSSPTEGGEIVFEPLTKRFEALPLEESSAQTALRVREHIKIGSSNGIYRGVMNFNPRKQFSDTVGERPYFVQKATLNLTSKNKNPITANINLQLSEENNISQAVTWDTKNPETGEVWTNGSGGLGSDQTNNIKETQTNFLGASILQFDVTDIISHWSSDYSKPLNLILHSPELEQTGKIIEIESMDSVNARIGDGVFTTCRFLTDGDTTSIKTKGVSVIVEPSGSNTLITLVDNDPVSAENFQSFQELVALGESFILIDPDTNSGINLGTVNCSVIDRPSNNSVIVSGVSMPSGVTKHETTVEFSATVTISGHIYILDIESPSKNTISEITALKTGDWIAIRYSTAETQNNSKDYTIKFVSDETLYNNRVRLFLNESVVSENRTGKPTEISEANMKPYLSIDLLLV